MNIQADAIVHPTNNSFFMGGDVGVYYSTKDLKEFLLSINKIGKALAAAGGQQLRDAVAQLKNDSAINNAGDGKTRSYTLLESRLFFI